MRGVLFKGMLLVFISTGLIFTLSCSGGSVKTASPQTQATEDKPLAASAEGELPAGWEILESEDIFFDKESYSLLPEAQAHLKKIAAWLLQNPEVNVVIKGYSDEPGTDEYNLALGDRRAGSVKSFLIRMGIDPSRLAAVSYGREGLAETGSDEASKDENRRVHIVIDAID